MRSRCRSRSASRAASASSPCCGVRGGRADRVRRCAQPVSGDVRHGDGLTGRERRVLDGCGLAAAGGVGDEGGGVGGLHGDVSADPGAGDVEGVAGSGVVGSCVFEEGQDVLGAVDGPSGDLVVVLVGEGASAADRDEAGVAVGGQDRHGAMLPGLVSGHQPWGRVGQVVGPVGVGALVGCGSGGVRCERRPRSSSVREVLVPLPGRVSCVASSRRRVLSPGLAGRGGRVVPEEAFMVRFTRSDDLRGARFEGVDLRGARFVEPDLSGSWCGVRRWRVWTWMRRGWRTGMLRCW